MRVPMLHPKVVKGEVDPLKDERDTNKRHVCCQGRVIGLTRGGAIIVTKADIYLSFVQS